MAAKSEENELSEPFEGHTFDSYDPLAIIDGRRKGRGGMGTEGC